MGPHIFCLKNKANFVDIVGRFILSDAMSESPLIKSEAARLVLSYLHEYKLGRNIGKKTTIRSYFGATVLSSRYGTYPGTYLPTQPLTKKFAVQLFHFILCNIYLMLILQGLLHAIFKLCFFVNQQYPWAGYHPKIFQFSRNSTSLPGSENGPQILQVLLPGTVYDPTFFPLGKFPGIDTIRHFFYERSHELLD